MKHFKYFPQDQITCVAHCQEDQLVLVTTKKKLYVLDEDLDLAQEFQLVSYSASTCSDIQVFDSDIYIFFQSELIKLCIASGKQLQISIPNLKPSQLFVIDSSIILFDLDLNKIQISEDFTKITKSKSQCYEFENFAYMETMICSDDFEVVLQNTHFLHYQFVGGSCWALSADGVIYKNDAKVIEQRDEFRNDFISFRACGDRVAVLQEQGMFCIYSCKDECWSLTQLFQLEKKLDPRLFALLNGSVVVGFDGQICSYEIKDQTIDSRFKEKRDQILKQFAQ